MKEFVKKIIVSLILMMMFLNSSFLSIVSIAVDEIEKVIDETKINVLQNIVLEKYVNYDIEDSKGVLTQFNLKTGIEYLDGEEYAPLGSTGILLNVPKIENEFPERVEVVGKSTKATNGSDIAKDFRFIYNKETGELKFAAVNEKDDEGNIYAENLNGARDEYTIICYYSENCYNDSNLERDLELSGFVQANIENEIGIRKRAEVSENWVVKENISGLVSTNVKTTEIYNGYIESNNRNETLYETEYIENLEIDVSVEKLCDEVYIVTDNNFVNKDNELNDKDKLIYKSTKIDKNKVMDLLGDDGYLQILNLKGEILGELNKDTEVGENGVYELIYQEELNDILIKTSKIEKLGTIVLQNTKNIKSSMTNLENNRIYSKNNIICLNNIEKVSEEIEENEEIIQNEIQEQVVEEEIQNEVSEEIEQKEIYNSYNENVIDIKDAESKIDLSIDKLEWTNKMQNDVEFNLNLISNDMSCRLFENPVLEIRLPEEVEKIILKEDYLLYSNGLNIEKIEVLETENKVIRVEFKGKQKGYYNIDMVEGTNLIIPATIILRKDIESVDSKIEVKCFNGEEFKNFDYDIKIVSSIYKKLELTQKVENVQEQDEQILTSSDIELETEITSTLGENVLKEGQEIHEREFIKYNIKLKNNSDFKLEGVEVIGNIPEGMVYIKNYFGEFSYNEYDKYMTEEDKSVTEYKEMIDLEPGEEKYLYYWTRANVLEEENEKNIQSDIQIKVNENVIEQYTLNNIIKKAEMEVKINARETEREDNLWVYDVKVTNRMDSDLKNVVVNLDLPNELKFRYKELSGYSVTETDTGLRIDVPVIEANSTKKLELFIQITRIDDSELDFEVQIYASAKADNTDLYYSNLNKEQVYTAGIEVLQTSEKEGQELEYDEEVEYNFVIKNISNESVKNKLLSLEIMSFIDENLVPISAEYEYYEYNEDTQIWEKMGSKTQDISQKYIEEGVDEKSISDLYIISSIPQGGEINLKIKCKAPEVYERTEVSNSLKIMYKYCGEHSITSNIIKNIILPRDLEEVIGRPIEDEKPDEDDGTGEGGDNGDVDKPGEGDKPGEEAKKEYTISGFAWEDVNKNGKYDEEENKLSDIIVKLFNSDTNSIVKDSKGKNLEVKTDNNGEYKFDDIIKGRYIVLFEYDNYNYSPTMYKKDMISEDKNSDVIKKDVAIDGVEKTVAVTDILNLENSNLSYINIGLIKNERFDLSLNKSISKIILKYDGFNKEYVYNQIKLAKVEIPSKKMNSASIEVEYLLEIKNEGDVSGYIEQLVDYLPDGFEFDSKLNQGWAIIGKQTLKNTTYSGMVIKPGESKVVKLYLTRKLSSDSIGTLTNFAEIVRSISINGNLDIDSVNGNKVQDEDDYSKAELIIAIKTGSPIYIGIAILMIVIVIGLRLLINKKIFNIKIISIFIIGLVVVLGGFVSDKTYSGGESEATYSTWSWNDAANYVKSKYTPSSTSSVGCYYTNIRVIVGNPAPSSYDWMTGPYPPNPGLTGHDQPFSTYHTAVNYVHYGGSHGDNELYCSEGGSMSNNGGSPYYYSYSSASINVTGLNLQSKTSLATIYDNSSSPAYRPCPDSDGDSDYFYVGPYSVTYNGSVTGYTVYYRDQYTGEQGEVSASIVDSSGNSTSIGNGSNFYLKVPKYATWITGVTVRVQKTATFVYGINYRWHENWTCGIEGAQLLGKDGTGSMTATVDLNSQNSVSLPGVRLPVGELKIEKIDYDTGSFLTGYNVRVQESKYYYNKIHTVSGTSLTIKNIPAKEKDSKDTSSAYTYTVSETKAPAGYRLDLQVLSDIKKATVVWEKETSTIRLRDRMYGNLVVEKIDKDKLEEDKKSWGKEDLHKLEDLVFSGAKFKIYYLVPSDKTATKRYIYNFVNKTSVPSTFETTTSKSGGQIFSVDANTCQFRLDNIPTYYNYYIEEIELSDDMLQYYDVSSEPQMVKWSADMSVYGAGSQSQYHGRNMRSNAYGDMWFGFTNKQLRVDIQGYVWEDISTSKLDARDNLYNAKNENVDKRIPKMPVYLKKDGKIIAVRYTYTEAEKNAGKGEVGEYFFPAKSTYNADGTGDEYTIVIEELSRYLIEFEYNGLKYQCVLPILNKDNGSKVAEEDKVYHDEEYHRRTIFNNNYYNISNVTKKDNGNEGKTETGVELIYSNGDNWNSELVQNTDYYSPSLVGDVDPTSSATMYADTETARDKTLTNYKYVIEWVTGRRVVRNINLGIYEREQPDLAIVTDLEDIDLTINGYSHKYEYKNRAQYVKDGVPDDVINENYDALLDGFSVGVKNSSNHNYNMSYTREIYDSYIAYTQKYKDNLNKLRVFVRYKIVVKNESSNLLSKVSLKNYADSRLEFSGSEYIDSSGNLIPLEWTGNTIQSGSVIKTTGEIPMYIKPTECITIYIRYELNTETITALSLLGTPGNQQTELELNRNVTEIMTYSTFSNDENEYGGIDRDSAPDNINYDKINTYEDDTDAAPGLAFKRKSSKLISGLVFEDKALVPEGSEEGTKPTDLFTDEVREGSKKYENGEKGVKDVDVQMMNKDGISVIKLYNLDSNGTAVVTNAQTITDANGKYEFTGMVPGEYYLQYTYGYYDRIDSNESNTEERVQTKIGDVNVTTESHKSTIIDIGRFKTLIENNIENNNGYNEIKADYEKNNNLGTPENSLWYWYQKNNNFAYSSAVDNKQMRQNINNKLKSIDYDVKANYDKLNPETDEPQDIHFIESYTGFMDFPIEDTKEQITDINYVEGSRVYQVKFGIIERPRQSVLIDKEINYVKISLANGQTLIEGNPLEDEIDYVTYPNNGGTLTIEIDNEIIEGATLDVGYQMEITNKSEIDYDTVDYYRYGTNRTNLVKLKIGSIVDYADEKLSLSNMSSQVKEYDNSNLIEVDTWYLINQPLTEAKLVGVPISPDVYNKIKKRKNMLVKYYANKELEPNENINLGNLSANKLLTDLHNSDQIFNNYVEILNVQNRVGRFYGEIKEDVWVLDTPGNFDVYDEINTSEADNNYYGRPGKRSARMQIIPPTGIETIIIYSVVGVICLAILAGGIIFIKKKVLD